MKKQSIVKAKEFLMNELGIVELPKHKLIISAEDIIFLMNEFVKNELTEYTDYLMKYGYCDTDVYLEGNSAIDRFMHPELRNK